MNLMRSVDFVEFFRNYEDLLDILILFKDFMGLFRKTLYNFGIEVRVYS